jgi:hypothetical protein
VNPYWKPFSRAADEISSVLASVSPILDDQTLYGRLAARADLGRFKASIGSTDALGGEYLVETVVTDDDDSAAQSLLGDNSNELDSHEEDDEILDELYESVTQGEIDLDEIMVSATHTGKSEGVDPAHLSKIWKIDLKTAEHTLEVTSQNSK